MTAAVWTSLGNAQGPKTEAQIALEREQATLTQQISAKQQQITALRNRPSPEQAELADAQKVVNEARAAYKAEANADNESKLKNAEFKFKLAERKYSKAHGDVEVLVDEVDKLRQQVAAKQQQIKALNQQAIEQQAAAAAQQQQRLAEERSKRQQQEQELQRSKQEAENQQREIERLKNLLAAKEAAAAREAAAKAAAAPAEPPKPAPVEVAKAGPVAMPQPAPAPAAAAPSNGLYKLVSSQEVVQELQQLEKRLANISARERGGVSENLYLKRPNTKATNKDKVTLKALGQEQYRGEAQVDAGTYELVLGLNRWPLTLAAADSGNLVFIYDNSDQKKPRLMFYSRKLEGGK